MAVDLDCSLSLGSANVEQTYFVPWDGRVVRPCLEPIFAASSGSECRAHLSDPAAHHAPHRLPFLLFAEHRFDIVQTLAIGRFSLTLGLAMALAGVYIDASLGLGKIKTFWTLSETSMFAFSTLSYVLKVLGVILTFLGIFLKQTSQA
jgi:hypothetical protein